MISCLDDYLYNATKKTSRCWRSRKLSRWFKGIISQGVCLLTDGRTTIADVRSTVERAGFQVAREIEAQESWCFGGPAVLIPYRPEVKGAAAIDVVDRPWPDAMGDPKSDFTVFGAWSMGQF